MRLAAGKNARQNVALLDATFSVTKSIMVLHTAFEAQEVKARQGGDTEAEQAWAAHRRAVEDAIWAGNRAGLGYLAEHAGYSRAGKWSAKTAGRYIDAHQWTVASFFQHDSRNHDPNLHIHNAILNRVLCSNGVWRTLDSTATKSAWTAPDLTRAINAALPDYFGVADGPEIARLLDTLTAQALTLAGAAGH